MTCQFPSQKKVRNKKQTFSRLLSVWETLVLVPPAIITPFFYVLDIVKDTIQVLLFVTAVNGLWYAFKNWSTFSSVVSIPDRIFI